MITIDEAYEIIVGINEEAHERSWDTWSEADDLEDSDDEDDWGKAESMREEASLEQAGYFREGFNDLDEDTQEAILHYVDTDENFKEEFSMWYGSEDFEADFG